VFSGKAGRRVCPRNPLSFLCSIYVTVEQPEFFAFEAADLRTDFVS
jgi:hypothetical protein